MQVKHKLTEAILDVISIGKKVVVLQVTELGKNKNLYVGQQVKISPAIFEAFYTPINNA